LEILFGVDAVTHRVSKIHRRLLAAIILLVVLAGALAVAGKFWIVPAVIRRQIRAKLADFWGGQVAVRDVEFNYRGPLRIRGLELLDPSGGKWIAIDSMEIDLRGWPSLSPVLQGMRVDGVRILAHVRGGKADWPLRRPTGERKERDLGKYFDVQAIEIGNIVIGAVHDSGRAVIWDGLKLRVSRRSEKYHISLSQQREGKDEEILTGNLEGKGRDSRLSLAMSRWMARNETAALLQVLTASSITEIEGHLDLEKVEIAGDFGEPETLTAHGTVAFSAGRIVPAGGPEFSDVVIRAELEGHIASAKGANLSAKTCGGKVTGDVKLQLLGTEALARSGWITADGVHLGELAAYFSDPPVLSRGTMRAKVSFEPGRSGWGENQMYVETWLTGADLYSPPLVASVLRQVGLGGRMQVYQDLDAGFWLTGQRLTVDYAALRNRLGSVAVHPGGTMDLGTGDFDILVSELAGDPFLGLNRALWGVDLLTRSLSCWRVRGNWNKPKQVKAELAPGEGLRGALDPAQRAARKVADVFKSSLEIFGGTPDTQPSRPQRR